jgi:transposase-like protein
MYAESLSKACAAKATFQKWAAERQHIKAVERIDDDWERMTAYYSYPKEHWTHLRTSNVVESPFASVRLRTEASKRYKKIEGATAMIWKLLMVAERNFRRIKGPELMVKLADGVKYKDGVESPPENGTAKYKQAA